MTSVIHLDEIKSLLSNIDTIAAMKEGFIQYSNGNSVVPPVAELLFEDPPGDVHIKYGYIKSTDYYCIKIASGFYENPKLGIPSSQGMMLLFDQRTGQPVSVLLDEGYLTDIRTAAAGALAAQYFAPKNVKAIGIIGTGIQAKLQLEYLQKVRPCNSVWVWGRNPDAVQKFINEMGAEYTIQKADTAKQLAGNCNLIVTATPSKIPLLKAVDIKPGTHITAMGSDTFDKQELEGAILKKADLIISDSIAQSKSRGEIFRAIRQRVIHENKVIELGTALQDENMQRLNDQQISVVDLTGVAVQDIMITTAVYSNYIQQNA